MPTFRSSTSSAISTRSKPARRERTWRADCCVRGPAIANAVYRGASGIAQWKLNRALDHIEEHVDRALSLEELSASLDMTPHYFGRLFRKSVGMPPHRYLITRRIERAKELLASTNKDMTAIALTAGFSSHSHFTTAFRRSVGYAPRMYRNSVRH
jgi:AraC family transcriptional regulator